MGWEVCRHPVRGKLVGHAGYNRGISTMVYREVDSGLFAAMYDNGDTGGAEVRFCQTLPTARRRSHYRRSTAREYGAALLADGPVRPRPCSTACAPIPVRWLTTKGGMNRPDMICCTTAMPCCLWSRSRINLLLHPDDANLYDSYGEGAGRQRSQGRSHPRLQALAGAETG